MADLFSNLPAASAEESVDEILRADGIRIERIVSRGHSSPVEGWYDQAEHEWVLVLEGAGRVLFEGGEQVLLGKGDHLQIPAHTRHKVTWTDPDQPTVWLAVFYSRQTGTHTP